MHRLRMTALAGVLALSTSGSDSSKTPFQPDLTTFFPKNPDQATSQNPVTLLKNQQPQYPTGLIETTNIQQRLKQLQQGQTDPFTRLFPDQLETAIKPEKVFPNLPKLPVKKELPVAAVKPTMKVPPNTRLAKGVAVEGVLQIGDKTHAIIKLPTDGTSRYVSQGQRLSDGQLLVKRIEISPDSEPLVTLEQNGVEISKAVGEQTDSSSDTIASSTLSQVDSDYKTRNEESDEKTNEQAANPQQVREQEEYTATIPVPSPPPNRSSDQKKSPDKVASSPPANSTAPTDTVSVREDYSDSELLSLNSQSSSLRVSTPDIRGQNSVANRHYRSSFDLSKKQQLIDQLRSGSKPEIENRLELDSPSTLQADLGNQTYQQQPISDRLGYKKRLATSNKLPTTLSNIEVLAHRQRLINELRRTTRHTNN